MTNQIHEEIDTTEDTNRDGVSRRRMFIAGAGLAGAAVIAKAGSAQALDDDPVLVGNPDNETDDGATVITNTNNDASDPGTAGQEAVSAVLTGTDNGSHAIKGVTAGLGHSVAGDTPAGDNVVAATWGRHAGSGAGIGGVNVAEDIELAGTARGVEGFVTQGTNGSHAVYGQTAGGGHAIAGLVPEDALGPDGEGLNAVAATWGKHDGAGAGIGGISAAGYGGEFVGGKGHVRLIQVDNADEDLAEEDQVVGPPTDDAHLIGELFADGAGALWYNQGTGSNFTRLTDQGIQLFDDAQRAFDSREEETDPANTNKGRFTADEIREIDLAEFTDLPDGASGAVINLTAADAEGLGFATVFNGDTDDADRPNASSINWVDTTDTIANGIIVKLSATNTVKVYTRTATEIIIDVVGWTN